jgi:hypothetical protein
MYTPGNRKANQTILSITERYMCLCLKALMRLTELYEESQVKLQESIDELGITKSI